MRGILMTDLTLDEYRNLSEEELRPVIREEAWKIYGCDSIKKQGGEFSSSRKVSIPLKFPKSYFLSLFKNLISPLDIESFLFRLRIKRYWGSPNFNTKIKTGWWSRASKGWSLKREVWGDVQRLLGCACIFSTGHLKQKRQEVSTGGNNGILGSQYIEWPVDRYLAYGSFFCHPANFQSVVSG